MSSGLVVIVVVFFYIFFSNSHRCSLSWKQHFLLLVWSRPETRRTQDFKGLIIIMAVQTSGCPD